MAGQLIFADLKEHKRSLDNSLNILLAIKQVCLNSGLGRLFPERISKIKVTEAGQLIFADLKEHKRSLDNSLNILLAIKHVCLNSGLGRLFPERISKIKVTEGVYAQQVFDLS